MLKGDRITKNKQTRTCGRCIYYYNFYCPLKNIQISYSSKTCNKFREKWLSENRFECYDLIFLDGFIKDTLTNENIVEPIKLIFLLNELNDENQQLKGALKELKEIGDYQAMRIQELDDMNSLIEDEIDKKITLLIDAKIQCLQNGDEELFGKIKFGIQILNELQEVMLND